MGTNILSYIAKSKTSYKSSSGKQSKNVNQGKGYGAEEWNNCPENTIVFQGKKRRYFYIHSENIEVSKNDRCNIVFWSSVGGAQLLGIALNATPFFFNENKSDRLKIVQNLNFEKRLSNLYELKQEGDKLIGYRKSKETLRNEFQEYFDCFANWYCDPQDFIWLDNPLSVANSEIIKDGKLRPNYRYSHPEIISDSKALSLINKILAEDSGILLSELSDIAADKIVDTTENSKKLRTAIIEIRQRQKEFRDKLDDYWKHKCAVTGLVTRQLLRASHIKPYSECNSDEEADVFNGLLLSANLDRLFDTYLISFEDDGRIIISNSISKSDKEELGLESMVIEVGRLTNEHKKYLAMHRREFKHREKEKN